MALRVVEADDVGAGLPEYPFPADLRLPTHHFITWFHRRYLNSRLRLLAPPEVRAYALELICIAQDQTPVGTLPNDPKQLAALLHVDLSIWDELAARSIPPLYKWFLCDCGGEIRYAHPVVIEMIGDAMDYQQKAKARSAAGTRRKRMNRLATQAQAMGAHSNIYGNPAALEWIDDWLEERCEGNRTASWVEKALEAYSSNKY